MQRLQKQFNNHAQKHDFQGTFRYLNRDFKNPISESFQKSNRIFYGLNAFKIIKQTR